MKNWAQNRGEIYFIWDLKTEISPENFEFWDLFSPKYGG